MRNFETKVLASDVVLHPDIIKEFLKKSHYWLSYKPEKETAELWVNHGEGGKLLLQLRRFPYESAAKLAEGLGLKADCVVPCFWSKFNPIIDLYDDGSTDAELLRMEILRLGIPHTVRRPSSELSFSTSGSSYVSSMYPICEMLHVIRKIAGQNREQLDTTP